MFKNLAAAVLILISAGMASADSFIVMQSTTSTQNSGLLDYILPKFRTETGIEVRVVAVGTGQALKNAQNGDGDVLLVHAKPAEEKFVAGGYGVKRFDVMYNDFVVVGPSDDPADIASKLDVVAAFAAIADNRSFFASRGDDSGTHKAELKLWDLAGVTPREVSGTWYAETGSGMGATLNIASGMGAYALTDRATWIAFANKGNLQILSEGDERLFNQYGVIAVNPSVNAHVKFEEADLFISWLTGETGQAAIASFTLEGQQLFFPNAN